MGASAISDTQSLGKTKVMPIFTNNFSSYNIDCLCKNQNTCYITAASVIFVQFKLVEILPILYYKDLSKVPLTIKAGFLKRMA